MNTQEENELICEKLLGWRRLTHNGVTWWEVPSTAGEFQPCVLVTPSFTTWAEAGLILDALQVAGQEPDLWNVDAYWYVQASTVGQPYEDIPHALTAPLAIRAAALAYIKAVRP